MSGSRRQYSLESDQHTTQHQYSQTRRREGSRDTEMSESAGSGSSPGTNAGASNSKQQGGRTGSSKRQKAERQPLRRGDACLMCRAKKLKCSATKPICDQCHKRKDRCVYDAIRPASRVEKLEKKLAQIEDAELKSALASRRHSEVSSSSGYKPYPNENLPRPPLSNSIDSGMYNGLPGQSCPPAPPPHYPDRPTTASSSISTPVLGPGVVDSWSFSDPFAPPHHIMSSSNPTAVQVHDLPWPLLSSSNDVSTMWGAASYTGGMNDNMGYDGTSFDFDTLNTDPAQMAFPPPAFMAPDYNTEPASHGSGGGNNDIPASASTTAMLDDVLAHATNYTGVQLSEADISQSARDYLLDLFFCPPRFKAGSEPWSEAQFRAKMKLGHWARPHPALLFAMYTVAATSSYIPAVRALADSLFSIAASKVGEAITQEDRLLDIINATKILSKWLFSKARALEAYSMSWKAVSLVHACQLDKITTNKWSPEIAKGGRTQENPWPLLGPPKDQWDLCERIHAFWGVWGTVRGASIMLPWQSPIRDETILTPLPYAPERYLDGTIHSLPDVNLRTIYELPYNGNNGVHQALNTSYAALIAATHLLNRAKSLRADGPEFQRTFRSLANRSTSGTRCLRIENQAAYTEIMDTAKYIHGNLPEDAQFDMLSSTPWTNPDVPIILVCLIGVRMHLHEPEGDEYDRDTSLAAAKEAASIIKLWIRQLKTDETNANSISKDPRNGNGNGHVNAKPTSRNKHGVAGPYVLVPWFWTANRLIRSAKVLRKMGLDAEASGLEMDAGLVIQGLRDQGVLYPMATESADMMERGS